MNIQLLPTWMLRRYILIWNKKWNNPLRFEDVAKILPDKDDVIAVFLSKLNKMGWVEVEKDANDARKRLYTFHDPKKNLEKVIEVMK